jgi:uncharacterized protein Yka (UPF0111/DUF47 family)
VAKGTRRNWAAGLFPVEHDFFKMLEEQSGTTREGVEAFCNWLERSEDAQGLEVLTKEREADSEHRHLESVLVKAFSTPIDRGDLYDISRQLDHMLDHVRDTIHEASALGVLPPQPNYARFAAPLRAAVRAVAACVSKFGDDPRSAEALIPEIREGTKRVRAIYYDCLHEIAHETDVNLALRRREVYHHLKDAGVMLDRTADVLHRIIVRIL